MNKCEIELKEVKQLAQLSQRDRAAGWVSCGQSIRLELGDNIYGHTGVTYLASKAIEFGEKGKIRAITPFKAIQGHRGQYQSKARMRLPVSVN